MMRWLRLSCMFNVEPFRQKQYKLSDDYANFLPQLLHHIIMLSKGRGHSSSSTDDNTYFLQEICDWEQDVAVSPGVRGSGSTEHIVPALPLRTFETSPVVQEKVKRRAQWVSTSTVRVDTFTISAWTLVWYIYLCGSKLMHMVIIKTLKSFIYTCSYVFTYLSS